ncbi:MAG: CapA family protein [Bacillota bacterium]
MTRKEGKCPRRWVVINTFTLTVTAVCGFLFLWPPERLAPALWRHREPATRVTIAAVGDLLMHMPVVNSARDLQTGGYDFSRIFAPVKPYLKSPDYTVANLETRLAGPSHGYRGFPYFNTPADLARDLRDTGVDLLSTANNHSLDFGWRGIVATLDNLDAAGVAHVGTYRSPGEKTPFLADIRGIKVAFLNYTATTNGLPLPPGKEFAVNLLNPEAVAADARAARRQGADLVAAVLHFGVEYQRHPDEAQRELAARLCTNGVDVIISSHPHVVQPIEKITVTRDGDPHTCVVAYSLGNFISNQRWRYSDSGIILYLHLEKDRTRTRVRGVEFLPLWVQRAQAAGRWQFRVLPVHPMIDPATDIPLTAADKKRMSQVWEELCAHLKKPAQGILPYSEKKPAEETIPLKPAQRQP